MVVLSLLVRAGRGGPAVVANLRLRPVQNNTDSGWIE
jgi:hypothetical protein